jgi:hypothetical protein
MMKIFNVTEFDIKSVTYRIRAENHEDALARIRIKDTSKNQVFLGIVDDDREMEYQVAEVNDVDTNIPRN